MKTVRQMFAPAVAAFKASDLSVAQQEALRANVFARIHEYERSVGRAPQHASYTTARSTRNAAYALHVFNTWFSKPVTALVAASVVLFSGWMTTVSAASKSLPGDTLYNVKLVNEYARLQLASLDRRAVLHTEFASRRLEEAAKLQETAKENPAVSTLVKSTLNAARVQIASATADVHELQEVAESASAVAVAVAVQQNISELDDTLALAREEATNDDIAQEAADTQADAVAAGETITAVAVTAHEQEPTALSEKELTALFERQLGEASARHIFDTHRIAMARKTLAANSYALNNIPAFSLPKFEYQLDVLSKVLAKVDVAIDESTVYFTSGDMRAAFERVNAIDAQLRELEDVLAEQEFILIAALHSIPSPVIVQPDLPLPQPSDAEESPSTADVQQQEVVESTETPVTEEHPVVTP